MPKSVKALLPESGLLALLLLIIGGTAAHADVVVMKNGRRIQGEIVARGKSGVVLSVPYGTMTIPHRQIAEIIEEDDAENLRKTGEQLIRRDPETGLEFLRRAVRTNPESASYRRALAEGLLRAATKNLEERHLQATRKLLDEASPLASKESPEGTAIAELRKELSRLDAHRRKLSLEIRQAIDARNIPLAYDTLSSLLKEFPEDRAARRSELARLALVRGHLHLQKEEYLEARDRYHEALRSEPDLIARVREPLVFAEIRGVAPLFEARQYAEARARLEAAQNLLPGEPALIYHLALCCEAQGEPSEAARLYAQIASPSGRVDGSTHLRDLRQRAESILTGSADVADAEATAKPNRPRARRVRPGKRETRHFVIHYHDAEEAREVEKLLEHHLTRLQRGWFRGLKAPEWKRKIDIYLHPDRDAYVDASSAPAWSNGITHTERRYGAIIRQEIHFNAESPQFLAADLPHEVTHLLVPFRFGSGAPAPLWVEEGLATTQEPGYKQQYYGRVVREALAADAHFDIPELLSLDDYPPEVRVKTFYAQSNSLVRFLIERIGPRRTFELLHRFCVHSPEKALEKEPAFASVKALDRAWKKWLRR